MKLYKILPCAIFALLALATLAQAQRTCSTESFVGCTHPCYCLDEGKNALGSNRCSSDCDCDGKRTCSSAGWCMGDSQHGQCEAALKAKEAEDDGPEYTSLGCYKDNENFMLPVILKHYSTSMTIEECAALAEKAGMRYFSTQDAGWCFGGNDKARATSLGASSGCTKPCTGDSSGSTICGGHQANSVYSLGAGVCGNGKVEADEECDDGNKVNDDMCSNVCEKPRCGDGIIQEAAGEQCEKSLLAEGEQCSCSRWCQNLPHGCGDPHILSFDGADFMFIGWADATFNMISHPSFQVNTFFRKYPKQDPTKTWIGALGMKIGATDRVEVAGAGKGKLLVKVNGEELAMNTVSKSTSFSVEYFGEEDGDKEVMIITPEIVIGVSIDSYNWNLDFEVEKISPDLGNMHGILGQSYKRMLEQRSALSEGKPAPHPVSGVEGEDKDYFVAGGLFGDDFTFNKFQGAEMKADADAQAVHSVASTSRKAMEVVMLATHAGYL